jgi:deoxyribose-phosphate aldolase
MQMAVMTTTSTLLPGTEGQNSPLRDWRLAARLIDHTLLHPDVTRQQVVHACEEAIFYGFATVFVHPSSLALAAALLHGTGVKVGSPVGFPMGAGLTTVKCFEAEELLRLGAQDLDMVMNVSALKSGDRVLVQNDIATVTRTAHQGGAILKVILETSLLSIEEKILACELSVAAGADYVKTSTATAGGGATVADVSLMRGVVGERAGVKASGGIRTAETFAAMLHAGASRIGSSASVAIVRELGAPELPRGIAGSTEEFALPHSNY